MTRDHDPVAEAASQTLSALIVEDSADDADLLVRELGRGGYEIRSRRVDTAAELEEALEADSWEIVFSDWAMPQFSAPDALEMVKAHELDVPFIIVSGTIGEDVAVAALRSGAHDFFLKDKLTLLVPAVERELREAAGRRERAQMQDQLLISERMASVGILAAGVAHEINNPLAVVIGNLALALRALPDLDPDLDARAFEPEVLKDVLDELRDAYEASERIRNVVDDLKLFARSDSDDLAPVDVRSVIESSLRMARNEIRHRAQLRTDFGTVAPVLANESRLGQVFLNLIVNAAQSIPEGQAEQNTISIATTPGVDGLVVVEVRDSGSGMSPDTMRQLFKPFFSTKPIGVGTGLGLSICHRIVTSVGGTISVESEEGVGTVFRVHLPATAEARALDDAAGPETGAPLRRAAVLVIDDEPSIGALVQRALGALHDVTSTTDAEQALAWIGDGRRYDVILCDLMMPRLTGMDFYEQVSRSAPDQAEAVIFLTGGAFTPRARQFLSGVPNERVDKPFDLRALRTLVDEQLGQVQ